MRDIVECRVRGKGWLYRDSSKYLVIELLTKDDSSLMTIKFLKNARKKAGDQMNMWVMFLILCLKSTHN